MRLLLIGCVFVLSAAQDVAKCQTKRCCTPKKWEGIQAPLGGIVNNSPEKPGLIKGITRFHYDDTKDLAASFTNITLSGQDYRLHAVRRKKTLYLVDLNTKKCHKSRIDKPFKLRKRCIPKNATCTGPFYVGSGNNKVQFNTFNTIKRGSNKTYLNVSASVTEKCIPLSETFFGRVSGQRIVETIRYYDVRVGIKDSSVFDVPRLCNSTSGDFDLASLLNLHKQDSMAQSLGVFYIYIINI
ncbi:ependymin-related protein 1-like [Gigantopelta aegis]|uniref:ependymin-related protein 1-like n=1 Tax=Gigantopelta aegis TaxID=1735272 RepID=UPI001B8893F1|nr:ependymin-related protein 1-like [Gigantopelta aegis]